MPRHIVAPTSHSAAPNMSLHRKAMLCLCFVAPQIPYSATP